MDGNPQPTLIGRLLSLLPGKLRRMKRKLEKLKEHSWPTEIQTLIDKGILLTPQSWNLPVTSSNSLKEIGVKEAQTIMDENCHVLTKKIE